MNKKRIAYNLIFNSLSQILTVAVAILIPRLVMVNIGSEANGLLSTVNQALIYLGLMEAGVGTVSLQALYGPVATGNRGDICSILAATRKFHLRTGIFYMLAVVAFSIFYPFIVTSDLPRSTITLVILFSGTSGGLGYFVHRKYILLIDAEGKSYLHAILSTLFYIIGSILKIILLVSGFDIVAVQASYLIVTLVQSALIYLYIRRSYPWLNLKVTPNHQSISQKSSVMIHQLCGLIFANTDTLLLSMSWGLGYASIYAVYTMVFSQLGNVISILTSSFMFALGQTLQADPQKFKKDYEQYELINYLLIFILVTVCTIMIRPFISIYTAGVTDADYLNPVYAPLFILVFLLTSLRAPAQTCITVAGHFKRTTKQAIAEAIINLMVSLSLLPFLGIVGVLIGTITALLYRSNDMIIYCSRHIHKIPLSRSYSRILRNIVLMVPCTCLRFCVLPLCNSIGSFILCGFLSTVGVTLVFLIGNLVFEKDLAATLIGMVKSRFTPSKG